MQSESKKQDVFEWDTPSAASNNTRRRHVLPGSSDSGDLPRSVWDAILSIPGVRSWRILRDVAFLLTSFPLGLAAFIVAIVGGVLGLSLSWLLIGIPILVWTVGFTLRFAAQERERLNAFLDLDLGEPRYPANNGENVLKHLWAVVRSPQVRNDLFYMALLFPIGIIELALVLLPLEFFVPSLLHLAFGSVGSFDVLGMELSSRPEAIVFMGLGAVLLIPMLILMNIATSLHAELARKLLQRRG